MRAKVVRTENGWEPAFQDDNGEFIIEPGFAKPTKAEAIADLKASLKMDAQIQADQRRYEAGYASACGYRN